MLPLGDPLGPVRAKQVHLDYGRRSNRSSICDAIHVGKKWNIPFSLKQPEMVSTIAKKTEGNSGVYKNLIPSTRGIADSQTRRGLTFIQFNHMLFMDRYSASDGN